MNTSVNLSLQFQGRTASKNMSPAPYRSLMAIFEQSKKKNYGLSIMKDAQFEQHSKLYNQDKRISTRKEKETNLTLQLLSQKMK